MIDFNALGAQEAQSGKNMTVATKGGGDYEPPAAGNCRLRFIGYVEVGKQPHSFQGKTSFKEKVLLTFEVSGPKHPVKVAEDGTKIPVRITIEETLSLNEKAWFFKLFNRMNYAGKAVHMVQLLGEAYKGEVIHRKYAKRGEDKSKPETWTGVAVELFKKGDGYTIQPPRVEDPETGDWKDLAVDAPVSPLRCFLWNRPDKAQWDSLFIDGEYPARIENGKEVSPPKSKNVYQNTIKAAQNFKDSPAYRLLATNGVSLDLPAAERPDVREDEHDPTLDIPSGVPANDDDVLAGIVK
jgi:hypothetical protein